MLGVEAYDFRSLPVGTIDIEEMFPLDFEEFCWSQGTDPTLWDAVKECFTAREPVPDFLHEMFLDLWLRYVLIGGMPEAVQVFADTHDTQLMRARQRGILDTYRADITRYVKDRVRARQIKTIFDAVPSQLNKESKRFIISGATDGKRFSRIASDFDWLADACTATPASLFPCTEPLRRRFLWGSPRNEATSSSISRTLGCCLPPSHRQRSSSCWLARRI